MPTEQTGGVCCAGSPAQATIVFACSGAADVGELADRSARQLDAQGSAAFSCLAAIAAGNAKMRKRAAAGPVLAIDGCPGDCTRLTLEAAGVPVTHHLRLTDLGFTKGHAPLTDERLQEAISAALNLLRSKT